MKTSNKKAGDWGALKNKPQNLVPFKKGGTTKQTDMKKKLTKKQTGGAKKYQKGGTGPGKGLFEQIKSTQEAIKKMPAGSAQEQKDYQDIIRIRNGEAIENGINRSIIFNPKGYKRVLELEDKNK